MRRFHWDIPPAARYFIQERQREKQKEQTADKPAEKQDEKMSKSRHLMLWGCVRHEQYDHSELHKIASVWPCLFHCNSAVSRTYLQEGSGIAGFPKQKTDREQQFTWQSLNEDCDEIEDREPGNRGTSKASEAAMRGKGKEVPSRFETAQAPSEVVGIRITILYLRRRTVHEKQRPADAR